MRCVQFTYDMRFLSFNSSSTLDIIDVILGGQDFLDLYFDLAAFEFGFIPWFQKVNFNQCMAGCQFLRLAHLNRLENRQPDLLKYLLVAP